MTTFTGNPGQDALRGRHCPMAGVCSPGCRFWDSIEDECIFESLDRLKEIETLLVDMRDYVKRIADFHSSLNTEG